MKTSAYSVQYDVLRNWLKAQREAKGLTLREVATLMDCHHSVIGKIEQARRKIDAVELVEYCEVLGVDPHEAIAMVLQSLHSKPGLKMP